MLSQVCPSVLCKIIMEKLKLFCSYFMLFKLAQLLPEVSQYSLQKMLASHHSYFTMKKSQQQLTKFKIIVCMSLLLMLLFFLPLLEGCLTFSMQHYYFCWRWTVIRPFLLTCFFNYCVLSAFETVYTCSISVTFFLVSTVSAPLLWLSVYFLHCCFP